MIILTKDQIVLLHEQLVEETGGSAGIRDEKLLESALYSPLQSFGDIELFPTIAEKAARLGFGLIRNHAFIDGNKRIGAHAMLVFLTVNGIDVEYTQKELCDIIIQVASGEKDYSDLLIWIKTHIK